MNRNLLNQRGQFIPISMMVMFTIVVFMVAVVNVYKVSKAKLKAQNLADAVALNLASQEAQLLNVTTDLNERLNHLYTGNSGASSQAAGQSVQADWQSKLPGYTKSINDASNQFKKGAVAPNTPNLLPPLSYAENTTYNNGKMDGGYIFYSQDGAREYAKLVQEVNRAQTAMIDAYHTFMGIDNGRGGIGSKGMDAMMRNDIKALSDPSENAQVITWNSEENRQKAEGHAENLQQELKNDPDGSKRASKIMPFMSQLKIKPQKVEVKYLNVIKGLFGTTGFKARGDTLQGLLNSTEEVGFMSPAWDDPGMPKLSGDATDPANRRVGAGARVIKTVSIAGVGNVPVTAMAQAYVMRGGLSGEKDTQGHPVFRSTYYVKLGK